MGRKRSAVVLFALLAVLAASALGGELTERFSAEELQEWLSAEELPEAAAALPEEGRDGLQPGEGENRLEVHFIDVGQGDATLLKCGDAAMLIDAGEASEGTAVQNYLKKQGVSRLNYLVLTHPDSDHIGGAPVVITKFEIDKVFMSDYEKDNQTYRKLIQALDDKGLSWSMPKAGSVFSLGDAVITILGPVASYSDPNNASLVLTVQKGENIFLFTGDAEEEAEADILENGLPVKADVYKAGHHGSKTASGEEFVEEVSPAYAVVSCGEGNSYGHPNARTLNTFRMRGIQVYRTDEQGSIVAVSDGSEISWNCAPSDTWKAGEPK